MSIAIHRCARYLWSRITPAHLLLIPLSWIFLLITKIRRVLLTRQQVKLPIPVIVIGNISVGGNGKTTLVIALAQILTRRGHKVGIISRGYKRRYPNTTILVDHDMDPAIIGDEACMIWKQCKCLIGISNDRNRAARLLYERDCEVVLSDDGLQRYDLYRSLEIAVTSEKALGNKHLLPAGPLRENTTRLSQCAHTINLVEKSKHLQENDGHGAMHYEIFSINRLDGKQQYNACDFPKNKPYRAICALGNAQGFFNILRDQGLTIETNDLPDHAPISEKLLKENKTDVIISEKDAVKLAHLKHMKHVWVVKVKPIICSRTLERIIDSIEATLHNNNQINYENNCKAIEKL